MTKKVIKLNVKGVTVMLLLFFVYLGESSNRVHLFNFKAHRYMRILYTISVLSLLWITSTTVQAQSSFESVVEIFSTSCAGSSCHSSDAPHPLKLEGSIDDIYANLINVDAINPAASENNSKLIVPGDPTASYLYRKVNGALYEFDKLREGEGQTMPINFELSDLEKETIRQWILWGAKKEGSLYNAQSISEYYSGNALEGVEPLPIPDPSEGFQVHLGTIFLEPGQEIEVIKPVEIPLGDSLEITGFEVRMNANSSHHYGIARVLDIEASTFDPGLNVVDNFLTAYDFFNNSEFITGSQLEENFYNLPENAAYRWEGPKFLNLNYHVKNYSSSGILPAEGYVNFYYQPKYQAEKEMKTRTLTYREDNVFELQILPNGQDTTFVMEHFDPDSDEYIQIWRLLPHTHLYGVDYDIFLRNADGSKGEQVYEGFYNYDLDFDQGFYDYSHATNRTFTDHPLWVKMSEGLILEATYNNPGPDQVGFGLTTDDEMFVGYYMYTQPTDGEVPVALDIEELDLSSIQVYPNPAKEVLFIDTPQELGNYQVSVFNLSGQLMMHHRIKNTQNTNKINIENLPLGSYFIQIQNGEQIISNTKFLKAN